MIFLIWLWLESKIIILPILFKIKIKINNVIAQKDFLNYPDQ